MLFKFIANTLRAKNYPTKWLDIFFSVSDCQTLLLFSPERQSLFSPWLGNFSNFSSLLVLEGVRSEKGHSERYVVMGRWSEGNMTMGTKNSWAKCMISAFPFRTNNHKNSLLFVANNRAAKPAATPIPTTASLRSSISKIRGTFN